MRGRRGWAGRPRRRSDRGRQDGRRRVRRAHRADHRPQGLLHDPDQGPVQPEVRRPGPGTRRGEGRAVHRGLLGQRRGAGRRHDDRGAAEHAVCRVAQPRRARLRRHGRGPLPRRPVPRSGVGGGHHPPARGRRRRVALGDGLQRRGVRRLARRGPWRRRRRRLRAPAGAALAAHDGRPHALRPVRDSCGRRCAVRGRRSGRRQPRPALADPHRRAAHGIRLGGVPLGFPRRPGQLGWAAGNARAAGCPGDPGRGDRGAGPGGAAAGDHVRLQPPGLRRRSRAAARVRRCVW